MSKCVGGPREGAGRPKGSRNKNTIAAGKQTLGEIARSYAPEALDVLIGIARDGESEAARVSAANSILDRAIGRPKQAIDIEGNPLVSLGQCHIYLPHNGRDALDRDRGRTGAAAAHGGRKIDNLVTD